MHYFIDNIKTYASVNKKGRELQIFVQQFDRYLIADECSLDALKCDIEHQIKIMNETLVAALCCLMYLTTEKMGSGQFL